jgi:hypothetical protein
MCSLFSIIIYEEKLKKYKNNELESIIYFFIVILQHDEKAITIGMHSNVCGMPWLRQKEEGGATKTCAKARSEKTRYERTFQCATTQG